MQYNPVETIIGVIFSKTDYGGSSDNFSRIKNNRVSMFPNKGMI